MTQCAIITIGSEILDGRTLDTNANFLARALSDLGFQLILTISCPDQTSGIVSAIQFCFEQGASFILTSGGLGPTTDDLTREAIAEYFQTSLDLNELELAKQQERYRLRGKEFPLSNQKQAMFPKGSEIILNDYGTAPGMMISDRKGCLIALPGVPRELKGMFLEQVSPALLAMHQPSKVYTQRFVYFNIPESALNDQVSSLNLPAEVEVIYETSYPENKLILRTNSQIVLEQASTLVRALPANQNLVSDSQLNLPEITHRLLMTSQKKIGLAESCTGGMLAELLTDFSGSSEYLIGSIVAYHNLTKEKFLDVSAETLIDHGAVSAECALAMAKGVRRLMGADLGVAITGVAGPTGGTEEKPVGTVFVALVDDQTSKVEKISISGQRSQVRRFSSYFALDMIQRHLQSVRMHYLG